MDSPVLINFMETCMEELMMPFKNTKIKFSKNNENLKLKYLSSSNFYNDL